MKVEYLFDSVADELTPAGPFIDSGEFMLQWLLAVCVCVRVCVCVCKYN